MTVPLDLDISTPIGTARVVLEGPTGRGRLVLGHGADEVLDHLPPGVTTAIQERQLGTGHATNVGLGALGDVTNDDTILVLYGDMPLLGPELLVNWKRVAFPLPGGWAGAMASGAALPAAPVG